MKLVDFYFIVNLFSFSFSLSLTLMDIRGVSSIV